MRSGQRANSVNQGGYRGQLQTLSAFRGRATQRGRGPALFGQKKREAGVDSPLVDATER